MNYDLTIENYQAMEALIKRANELYEKRKKFNPIEDVNLFSILGMENKEVSAHSAFLFFVFKPFYTENGERDDRNLKELYKQLTKGKDNYPSVDDLNYIDIQREYAFSGGRLDFLITYSDKVKNQNDAIVIELKIWAGEQSGQIARYRQFLDESGYSTDNIYFLTPTERKSETGFSNNIVLGRTISETLTKIKELRKSSKAYITIIDQYIGIIKKLMGEENMNGNFDTLIKTKADIEAADMLFEQKTNALHEMLTNFMNDVQNELCERIKNEFPDTNNSASLPFEFLWSHNNSKYLESYYKNGSSCYPAIIIKLKKEWLNNRLVELFDRSFGDEYFPCFYIEIDETLYAGFTIKYANNMNTCEISKIKKELKIQFNTRNTTNWFLDYDFVKYEKKKIDFKHYDDENTGVLRLFEKESLRLGEKAKQIANIIFDDVFMPQFEKLFET